MHDGGDGFEMVSVPVNVQDVFGWFGGSACGEEFNGFVGTAGVDPDDNVEHVAHGLDLESTAPCGMLSHSLNVLTDGCAGVDVLGWEELKDLFKCHVAPEDGVAFDVVSDHLAEFMTGAVFGKGRDRVKQTAHFDDEEKKKIPGNCEKFFS